MEDDSLADLKAELIDALQLAIDENGEVLVWTGDGSMSINLPPPKPVPTPASYTPNHLAERMRSQQQAMEARGAQEGERKTITVLFADLVMGTGVLLICLLGPNH